MNKNYDWRDVMDYVEYRNAYSEVLYLINNMQPENKNRIPKKFIEFLEDNKNYDYKISDISLENANSLKKETKIVLSIIYRYYFCSQEEKIKMQENDEKALNELYNYDNIFKTNNEDVISEEESFSENELEAMALIGISGFRNFINRIRKKIKKFFNRY